MNPKVNQGMSPLNETMSHLQLRLGLELYLMCLGNHGVSHKQLKQIA
jgi:hypothetical protein